LSLIKKILTECVEVIIEIPGGYICGYDVGLTSMLYYGFKYGFPLHFKGARSSFFANNLVSAQQNPEIVSAINFSKSARPTGLLGLSITLLLLNFVFLPWELFLRKLRGSIA
jgi:hypothetical protein